MPLWFWQKEKDEAKNTDPLLKDKTSETELRELISSSFSYVKQTNEAIAVALGKYATPLDELPHENPLRKEAIRIIEESKNNPEGISLIKYSEQVALFETAVLKLYENDGSLLSMLDSGKEHLNNLFNEIIALQLICSREKGKGNAISDPGLASIATTMRAANERMNIVSDAIKKFDGERVYQPPKLKK